MRSSPCCGLLAGAGASSPTPSTPGWIAAADGSGGGVQQLLASPIRSSHAAGTLRAQAASTGSLQQGVPGGWGSDDAYSSHIADMVMQKMLARSAAGAGLPNTS